MEKVIFIKYLPAKCMFYFDDVNGEPVKVMVGAENEPNCGEYCVPSAMPYVKEMIGNPNKAILYLKFPEYPNLIRGGWRDIRSFAEYVLKNPNIIWEFVDDKTDI